MRLVRRIGRDLARRQHVELYVVALASIVMAFLSLVGDVVSDDIRWGTVFAALGLLTYQVTLPDRVRELDEVLHDRVAFQDITFASRVRHAREVWVLGPSAITVLGGSTHDALRKSVLARRDGILRVMVLDPTSEAAVKLAAHQLDDATDYAVESLPEALRMTVDRLELMAAWDVAGSFEHRYVGFNPGFSMVAFDPNGREGLMIVEFHGVHNESPASRMHIQLTRSTSEHWYVYWRDQFEHLWHHAPPPEPARGAATQEAGG